MALRVTPRLEVPEEALSETYGPSPGPGGQNVNKVASAVRLRLDLARAGLPEAVEARLRPLAGRRLTLAGEVIIEAHRHRDQARNRADARERLAELLREAATPPRARRPTRPTLGSKLRRLDGKTKRGAVKRLRGGAGED